MLPEETHCPFGDCHPFHNFPENTLSYAFMNTLAYKHQHQKYKKTN